MNLQIRLAKIDEAAAIYQIIQVAFAEYDGKIPVPPEASQETLAEAEVAAASGRVVLALDGTIPIGTVRYHLYPDYLHVGRLAVLPTYRGCGVGAALMKYLEELAPTLGRTVLRLSTRQSMPGNLAFYERLGYQVTKIEPYPKGPDTNVWFAKELTGSLVPDAERGLHNV